MLWITAHAPKTCPPSYRRHRASGQAVVSLSGQDFYLGPYGTKVSMAEYDRVVGDDESAEAACGGLGGDDVDACGELDVETLGCAGTIVPTKRTQDWMHQCVLWAWQYLDWPHAGTPPSPPGKAALVLWRWARSHPTALTTFMTVFAAKLVRVPADDDEEKCNDDCRHIFDLIDAIRRHEAAAHSPTE